MDTERKKYLIGLNNLIIDELNTLRVTYPIMNTDKGELLMVFVKDDCFLELGGVRQNSEKALDATLARLQMG